MEIVKSGQPPFTAVLQDFKKLFDKEQYVKIRKDSDRPTHIKIKCFGYKIHVFPAFNLRNEIAYNSHEFWALTEEETQDEKTLDLIKELPNSPDQQDYYSAGLS